MPTLIRSSRDGLSIIEHYILIHLTFFITQRNPITQKLSRVFARNWNSNTNNHKCDAISEAHFHDANKQHFQFTFTNAWKSCCKRLCKMDQHLWQRMVRSQLVMHRADCHFTSIIKLNEKKKRKKKTSTLNDILSSRHIISLVIKRNSWATQKIQKKSTFHQLFFDFFSLLLFFHLRDHTRMQMEKKKFIK